MTGLVCLVSSQVRQALHGLVRDQRILAASSEAHGLISGQTGCTEQSELSAELRRDGTFRAAIHESQVS